MEQLTSENIEKAFELTYRAGYLTGRVELRNDILEVLSRYSDLAGSELFTSRDAFKLIIGVCEESIGKEGKVVFKNEQKG